MKEESNLLSVKLTMTEVDSSFVGMTKKPEPMLVRAFLSLRSKDYCYTSQIKTPFLSDSNMPGLSLAVGVYSCPM